MDEEIKANVELALSSLLPEALTVSVRSGVVTLEGAFNSYSDTMEAERLARQVQGVRDVINRLVVEPFIVSLDSLGAEESEIAGKEDAMDAVEEGEPYFPPTDPVVWPSSSSDQGLEVRGGFAPDALDETFVPHSHETLSHGDDEITDEVQRAFSLNAITADLDIEVETIGGIVYLRGHVGSLDELEEAEAIAGTVPGVVEVVEELEIE